MTDEFTTDDVQPNDGESSGESQPDQGEIPTGPGFGQVAFVPWQWQFAMGTNPANGEVFLVLITTEQNHTSQFVGDIPTFVKFTQQLQQTIQAAVQAANDRIIAASPADLAALDAQLRGQRRDGVPPRFLPWRNPPS